MSRSCRPLRSGLGMLCQSSRCGSSNSIVAVSRSSASSDGEKLAGGVGHRAADGRGGGDVLGAGVGREGDEAERLRGRERGFIASVPRRSEQEESRGVNRGDGRAVSVEYSSIRQVGVPLVDSPVT